VDDFGLPKGENPFVIHDTKKGHKYPASSLFSGDSLKEHLEAFLANKLESYVKSEPIPESQPSDGPVVVVGKNFEDIVLDSTKDVLLEAYAPWCGHCKTLEPKYKELAQEMKKYDSVTIAKVDRPLPPIPFSFFFLGILRLTFIQVDATANDLPPKFAVSGFPTIFFVPANKKDAPIKYDGAREVSDFVSYIKKHASIPLKENATKQKEEL
jgi:protein disulfide isomerase family A protein 3